MGFSALQAYFASPRVDGRALTPAESRGWVASASGRYGRHTRTGRTDERYGRAGAQDYRDMGGLLGHGLGYGTDMMRLLGRSSNACPPPRHQLTRGRVDCGAGIFSFADKHDLMIPPSSTSPKHRRACCVMHLTSPMSWLRQCDCSRWFARAQGSPGEPCSRLARTAAPSSFGIFLSDCARMAALSSVGWATRVTTGVGPRASSGWIPGDLQCMSRTCVRHC